MSLTKRILLAMVLGVATGVLIHLIAPSEEHFLRAWLARGLFDGIGQVFVRSLTLLVVPLVFVSLVCGSAALGGHSRMGAMAGKTIGLYLATTAVAITLALGIGQLVKPGEGIDMPGEVENFSPTDNPSIKDTLVNIFPSNPVEAMAEGNMLQIIVFALLLGLAISQSDHKASHYMQEFFNHLNTVILKLVMILMHLAPYGVFCLLAKLFANLGWQAIADLALYFFTLLFVLLLHGLGTYSLLLKSFTRLSPTTFFRKMWSVMVFGFSTASSNATIPVTLRTVEKDLGVDNRVASFTVPLGATINMDGTAIMQGVATAFIAQVYGIDISLSGYLMVVLTATLASIGTAGVPGVGMITLAMVLKQAGLPVEGVALIIGVDRLLDMVRTAVNVTGDAMVSTIVANSEGMLDRKQFERPLESDNT
ncbi:dicarboxylate/amino acid:cation symporter [Marinimicrobium agarilyticum]|uniref:dicarboxylate/amino acid:cation symporter n=1 Tax=Marinimicrobium agarilyticum TaxID=306546 RepID=UPI000403AC8C|nr:dicarboxylate/amino acid:cation symporter [Marinimicrobium agarilyticum]